MTQASDNNSARDIVRTIRASPGISDLPVLVGGRAFASDAAILDRLGATAGAQDATSALDLADRILT